MNKNIVRIKIHGFDPWIFIMVVCFVAFILSCSSKRRIKISKHFQKVPRKKSFELLFGQDSKVRLSPVGKVKDPTFPNVKHVAARKMCQDTRREIGFRKDNLQISMISLLVKDRCSGEVVTGIHLVQMGYHLLNA